MKSTSCRRPPSGPTRPHPDHPAVNQPGIDVGARLRPDTETFGTPGRKPLINRSASSTSGARHRSRAGSRSIPMERLPCIRKPAIAESPLDQAPSRPGRPSQRGLQIGEHHPAERPGLIEAISTIVTPCTCPISGLFERSQSAPGRSRSRRDARNRWRRTPARWWPSAARSERRRQRKGRPGEDGPEGDGRTQRDGFGGDARL